MNLVSIEAPAPRVALAGKTAEFLDTPFGIVAPGQLSQVVANQLIEALAQGIRPPPGAPDQLLIH